MGNQNFSTTPFNRDQISQQMALVNELLGVTSNPAATAALQRSRDILSAQSSQLVLQ
jgi:hypothetical protein